MCLEQFFTFHFFADLDRGLKRLKRSSWAFVRPEGRAIHEVSLVFGEQPLLSWQPNILLRLSFLFSKEWNGYSILVPGATQTKKQTHVTTPSFTSGRACLGPPTRRSGRRTWHLASVEHGVLVAQVLVTCDGNDIDEDVIHMVPGLWNDEQEAAGVLFQFFGLNGW